MGWKNLPYWARGGIIVELIYIVISILLIPFGNLESEGGFMSFDFPYWSMPTFIVSGIIFNLPFLGEFFDLLLGRYDYWGFFPVAIIVYFLLGAIIGFIIKKIKQKKNGG